MHINTMIQDAPTPGAYFGPQHKTDDDRTDETAAVHAGHSAPRNNFPQSIPTPSPTIHR